MPILWRLIAVAALMIGAATANAESIRIEVKNLGFAPADIKAHVGDTIEWVNSDFVVHSATAWDGRFDVMLEAGKSGLLTVHKVGAVEYYCRFHPNMTGRIAVEE